MTKIPIKDLALEWEHQPRTVINEDVVAQYADAMRDGAEFPPVTVFANDDGRKILVDGFYRIHAAKAVGSSEIEAEIRNGSEQDALRFTLSANATHGLPRDRFALARAFAIAIDHKLVDAFDADGVRKLLKCSRRTADALTEGPRNDRDHVAKSLVANLHVLGISQRKIAAKLKAHGISIDQATVSR